MGDPFTVPPPVVRSRRPATVRIDAGLVEALDRMRAALRAERPYRRVSREGLVRALLALALHDPAVLPRL